jgi:hypothetical protein
MLGDGAECELLEQGPGLPGWALSSQSVAVLQKLGAAILSGRVDYTRALEPGTFRKVAAIPGMSTAKFCQSVIRAATR